MAKAEALKEKSEKALMQEYKDLLTIQKLVERYSKKEGEKNETPVIDAIKRELKREERDERLFNKTLLKFEKVLVKSFKDNPRTKKELDSALSRIEIYRKELMASLSKGGQLEKIAKSGDIDALRAEIEKDLRTEQGMYQQIEKLWKEMDAELEAKKKHDRQEVKLGKDEYYIDLMEADITVLQGAFEMIEQGLGARIDEDSKTPIRRGGIIAKFSAKGGPYNTDELNYATILKKVQRTIPVRMEFECRFATSGHKEIIRSGNGPVVNAGILLGDKTGMRFSSFSSSWTTGFAPNGSPLYEFGNIVNTGMIKVLGLK